MPEIPPGEKPIGPNHALLVGEVMGSVTAKLEVGLVTMLDTPEGDHTDEFLIWRPSGVWRVSVKPEAVSDP